MDADRRGSRILSCGRGGVRTGPEGVGGRRRSAGDSVEWQGVHHPGDTPWSQGLLMGMGGSEPGPGHGRARARGDPSESQDRRRCGRGAALHPRAASTQRRRREPRSQLRKDDSPLGTGHGRRSQFQLGAVSGWGDPGDMTNSPLRERRQPTPVHIHRPHTCPQVTQLSLSQAPQGNCVTRIGLIKTTKILGRWGEEAGARWL